jgi:uncharacterized membrane protein YidH (DUF202 family)
MVYRLTGGAWGALLLRPLEAAMRTLPLIAVLGLPLLLGLDGLYPWARAGASHDAVLAGKTWYLNVPFFLARAAVCFAVWLYFARRMNVAGRDGARLRRAAIAGLIAYALTVTLAGIDWIMSLSPDWYSTTFGLLTGVAQSLAGFAAAMVAAGLLVRRGTLSALGPPRVLQDVGNLMLMFVLLWTYLAFMQYLIIWAEDLPREIGWYLPRLHTSWYAVALALVVFHFALPFLILLSRRAKRSARGIVTLGGLMLGAHWVDVLWLVAPAFRTSGLRLELGDPLAMAGIGGIVVAAALRHLGASLGQEADTRPLDGARQHG